MKKGFIVIMLLVSIVSIHAQTIRGKIVDENQNPIEMAVIVIQTIDSAFVNSAYTDSMGLFILQSDLSDFRLIVQHMNYQVWEQSYSTNQTGVIQLEEKENTLKAVIIKGERPLVKMLDGRITYDIPRLLEGKIVSNAYESLLQLPGIREQDGNLVLAGSNRLTVIINDKANTMTSDQLTQLLKNTPKERIEKVEVMYSAPPQYHVRGGAVNIVLKKGFADKSQWQGQINGGYTQKKIR